MIKRVLNHRPTEQLPNVFIRQPDAAGPGKNHSKCFHRSTPNIETADFADFAD